MSVIIVDRARVRTSGGPIRPFAILSQQRRFNVVRLACPTGTSNLTVAAIGQEKTYLLCVFGFKGAFTPGARGRKNSRKC